MMCHRIGRSPISTIGLGLAAVSSDRRVPSPPARMTTFTTLPLPEMTNRGRWLQCMRLFTDGSRGSATRDMAQAVTLGYLEPVGERRSRWYRLGERLRETPAVGEHTDPHQLVPRV